MPTLNLQTGIKDDRADSIKLRLEQAIDMPTMEDPENLGQQIPMFDTTKKLVEWYLGECLKRAAEQGHTLLKKDEAPFDNDFIK